MVRITGCLLAGALSIGSFGLNTYAAPVAGVSSVTAVEIAEGQTPAAGVSQALAQCLADSNDAAAQKAAEQAEQVSENDTPVVASEYTDIAIAQVDNYVNVRSEPNTDSEVLGKLYNNSAGTILETTDNGWYRIKSGNVDGYVKCEYVVPNDEELAKGEFVSIMGPSGCGKSTLLNIMGLLDAPSSGKIEINGTSVESMKDKELAAFRNKTLGFVFQSFHLINSLNVIDNVELPLLYRKMAAKERTRLAKEVLDRVGLSHRMRHMPTQLSGGQCQRVAIARAIVGNPEIILADEPTGNLDSKMGAEVMELLHKLNKEDGRTIVMVTHNEEQAKQTSRTIRFFDGRQVQ